mmetsp:Transcript_8512/g.9730  ORF Transcript_8512/g.9730 Transcript_8512/m.9730 type:complete len:204 (+) Transcript_8512:258-869(+)
MLNCENDRLDDGTASSFVTPIQSSSTPIAEFFSVVSINGGISTIVGLITNSSDFLFGLRTKVGVEIRVVFILSNTPAAIFVAPETAEPAVATALSTASLPRSFLLPPPIVTRERLSFASNCCWYLSCNLSATDRSSSTVFGPAPNKSIRTRRSVRSNISEKSNTVTTLLFDKSSFLLSTSDLGSLLSRFISTTTSHNIFIEIS